MSRREKKEQEQRARSEFEADRALYVATLDAPPHPHSALGIAAGQERLSVKEAVTSMQADARSMGADGVLGVAICVVNTPVAGVEAHYVAYGTAVCWAPTE